MTGTAEIAFLIGWMQSRPAKGHMKGGETLTDKYVGDTLSIYYYGSFSNWQPKYQTRLADISLECFIGATLNNHFAFPKEKLLQHVGSMDQLAPVQRIAFLDGRAKSVEAFQIGTGSGLAFTVLVDRAMDLASLTYNGRSLCWRSPAGIVAPTYYERQGNGWLRGFSGMLATCGLRNVGPATSEGWETYGVHGEISYAPASDVSILRGWEGDRYRIQLSGQVRESYLFGPNLTMLRTWRTEFGADWIELEDCVTNEGCRPEIHLQLYHWNFGFPFLNERSRLYLTTDQVQARDEVAKMATWKSFCPPTSGFSEEVFFHSYREQLPEEGRALVSSDDGERNFAVELSHSTRDLPYVWQWKMCGMGDYVLGVEPTNCLVGGRGRWQEWQQPKQLQPGEIRRYRMRLTVLPTPDAVAGALRRYVSAQLPTAEQ
jgi:uncharacterized protein DUF4432